jgi:nitroimidazol reductase NimA-like FMN-containing flavoprotein (pyridoxamine 5'-phosphate oxidase superfamily)
MKLTKREADFIKSQGVARLATIGVDGAPHNVPVCPVFDRGKVYVGTESEAKKVKNIRSNPHVAIVFDQYRDSWNSLRGVMLQCSARILEQKQFKNIRKKLYDKYPKYESESALEPGDSVILEFLPEKKFTWGFD